MLLENGAEGNVITIKKGLQCIGFAGSSIR